VPGFNAEGISSVLLLGICIPRNKVTDAASVLLSRGNKTNTHTIEFIHPDNNSLGVNCRLAFFQAKGEPDVHPSS
jgi:hypothetical protein